MEFIFKKGEVILERLTELEAEEKENTLKEIYAKENFKSIEITFLEGTKFEDVGDVVDYIFENDFKSLTVNFY